MDRQAISYGQLIRLPNVLVLLGATCLSRLADRMFAVAIVLYVLAASRSPSLAGWIACASMAPGLLVSPIAGALLDRAGATRSIVIDMVCGVVLILALATAVLLDRATPWVMLLLTAAYALTSPLSGAGIRVLLPRLVPRSALDRANALDSTMFAVADVVGPSLAGALLGFAGPVPVFVTIAVIYAAAAACVVSLRHGSAPSPQSRPFMRQASRGLIDVVRRPLLRNLAIGYSLNMVTWVILVVAVPVVIGQHFAGGTWESMTGLLWAGVGCCGGIGALIAGHLRLFGRETKVMTLCMIVTAIAIWPIAACLGMPGLTLGLLLVGLLAGAIDVGLLTLRQRRTEPDRLGRVLAVSMSVNQAGFPIGSALGGVLVAWSPSAAFAIAALASLLGALTLHWFIPAEDAELPT